MASLRVHLPFGSRWAALAVAMVIGGIIRAFTVSLTAWWSKGTSDVGFGLIVGGAMDGVITGGIFASVFWSVLFRPRINGKPEL